LLLQPLPGDRIGGKPVIQVEQHRGTFRCGAKQVAKFPHGVRANRVALVFRDEPAVGALGCENIEVVVPEIHHHFLQLAFAVNGARHLGHRKLGDDALRQANLLVIDHAIAERALPLSLALRRIGIQVVVHGLEIRHVQRVRHLHIALAAALRPGGQCSALRLAWHFALRIALHGGLHGRPHLLLLFFPVFLDGNALAARRQLGLGKFVKELCGRHFQGGETREARIECGIVNRIGMQLLLDPFLQAQFLHAFQVTRTRPKTQSIERLQDGFVLRQPFIRQSLPGS